MLRFLALCVALWCLLVPAQAFEIQEVTSAKGIKAWLVEDHQVPIISMSFAFEAGRYVEAPGEEGTLRVLTASLKEGAGTFSADNIKTRLVQMTSSYGFSASADDTSGYLETLTKNLDETAALLKASLESPRFEQQGFQRVLDDALQGIAQSKTDQTTIASDAWFASAFPNHVYGTPARGNEANLTSLTTEDLRAMWRKIANRRGLHVTVVGDIDPAALSELLDNVFGNLPDNALPDLAKPAVLTPGPLELRIAYDNPQSVVYFGNATVESNDRARWAAYLLAEIIGGRPSFSRLNQALREKTGLTYGVYHSDNDWEFGDVQMGSYSTANETLEQSLAILRKEFAEMASKGPTAEELRKVKSFIIGSYPLVFSDSESIARELLDKKQRGHTPAYFKNRETLVNSVTLEDVKAVAAKILKPENQLIVVVGRQSK